MISCPVILCFSMIKQPKRSVAIFISIVVILLVPFIAMQFTDEVQWSGYDFLIMGALLLCAGFLIEMVLRKIKKRPLRLAMLVLVVLTFSLVWAELGVGIF